MRPKSHLSRPRRYLRQRPESLPHHPKLLPLCAHLLWSSPALLALLVEANHESYEAVSRGGLLPFGFVHEGLDQEHAHAPRILIPMHLAVNVRSVRRIADSGAIVDDLDHQFIVAGREYHPHA